jgi:phosphoserine phosphatase RsbU/P
MAEESGHLRGATLRRLAIAVGVVLGVVFVGWLDNATGLRPDVTVLYLVPIGVVTYEFGLWPGIAVALASAVVEILAHPGGTRIGDATVIADALTHLAVFVLAAVAVARLLTQLRRIRHLEQRRNLDLSIARDVHAGYLQPPRTERTDVSLGFRLAFAFELGGDYFHVSDTDRGLFVSIGDISGKGTTAALFTVALHGQMLGAIGRGPSPAEVVRSVNQRMYRLTPAQMFVTLFCALIDDGRMEFVNAGHEPPLLLPPSAEEPLPLMTEGTLPVGIEPDTVAATKTVAFPPGSVLLAVTDGVTDSYRLAPDARSTVERLLLQHRDEDAQRIADVVFEAAAAPQGESQRDDIIVLCVRALEV